MCTVTINVDEATMRQINPSLASSESIGKWLQHKVDLMMEEIVSQNADTMDVEELRLMLHETVRKEYALP
jgi:hypothetical protein